MRIWYRGCASAFQAEEDRFDAGYPLQDLSAPVAEMAIALASKAREYRFKSYLARHIEVTLRDRAVGSLLGS
jgi:hypothetical protein